MLTAIIIIGYLIMGVVSVSLCNIFHKELGYKDDVEHHLLVFVFWPILSIFLPFLLFEDIIIPKLRSLRDKK